MAQLMASVLGRAVLLMLVASVAAGSKQHAAEAIQKATEKLIEQLGWKSDEVSISAVDLRDIQLGEAVMYEFDIDVGGSIVPIRLAEDVKSWRHLPQPEQEEEQMEEVDGLPVGALAPFQLAGPVELWIQDSDNLRLAVPHDVDAGLVNRVLLAEGANVTVMGAREVSLARPLRFPLLQGGSGGLLSLGSRLHGASLQHGKPLLSLRIVGPTSMVASSGDSEDSRQQKLKVKRVAPGAVELLNRNINNAVSNVAEQNQAEASWLWPLPLVNSSNVKLEVLAQALDAFGDGGSTFNLLRAKAVASSFIKVEFELDRNAAVDEEEWPKWATKPHVSHRLRFELMARLDKSSKEAPVVPLSVRPLDTVVATPPTMVMPAELLNGTGTAFSKASLFLPPLSPLTLGVVH